MKEYIAWTDVSVPKKIAMSCDRLKGSHNDHPLDPKNIYFCVNVSQYKPCTHKMDKSRRLR